MTITKFLEARISEDEAAARQEDEDYADTTLLPTYDSDHQYNWNTARVLAECAAKREIVDTFRTATLDLRAQVILAALAGIYKDHPDYQQEWAV